MLRTWARCRAVCKLGAAHGTPGRHGITLWQYLVNVFKSSVNHTNTDVSRETNPNLVGGHIKGGRSVLLWRRPVKPLHADVNNGDSRQVCGLPLLWTKSRGFPTLFCNADIAAAAAAKKNL